MTTQKRQWLVPAAMLAGLVIGLLINALLGGREGPAEIPIRLAAAFGSTVFIGLLKLLVVPLIFTTIFLVVGKSSTSGHFGKSVSHVFIYYAVTTSIAVCISLLIANVLRPGVGPDGSAILTEMLQGQGENVGTAGDTITSNTEVAYGGGFIGTFERFLTQLIPSNAFEVLATNSSLLGVIFVAAFLGFAAARVPEAHDALFPVVEAIKDVVQWGIEGVIRIAPIGVFCLALASSSVFGLNLLSSLALYFFCVVLALLAHACLVLLPSVWYIAKLSPIQFLGGMREALVTAFSTSSSAASLPVTTRCLNTNLKVRERSTSMVLPLGTTINMDGTALYECMAVLFVAQGLGFDLSLSSQIVVVILAIATSIGVAPVPSASLVAIALILENVGVPGSAAAIGLLYAIDRPLDMLRTAINVMGDSVGATLHDRAWSGKDEVEEAA